MELNIEQSADRNMIFYGVYDTRSELPEGDMLCGVRRRFFESGRKQKNRSTVNVGGILYRCSYNIEDGRPLKWKKLIENRISERVTITGSGYYIESLDSGRRVYKRSYFDFHHNWLHSDFPVAAGRTAAYSLTPSDDGERPVIIKKMGKNAPQALYPFEHILDKAITDRLNSVAGEPDVLCATSSGSFYFLTVEECAAREAALEELLNNKNTADEKDTEDEIIEPGFEILEEDTDEPENGVSGEKAPDEEEEVNEPSAENEPTDENDNKPEETKEITEPEEPGIQDGGEEENKKPEISPVETTENYPAEEYEPAYAEADCSFAEECPYEHIEKMIIESGGRQYFYFGDIVEDKRSGSGRTAMSDGRTAYEGGYKDDKRDGFGVYYYKSGRLCYAGGWRDNKRDGLGVAFSSGDGSAFVGKWEENTATGVGANFDRDGRLVYVGKTVDGKRNGTGITYSEERDTFFVGKYKDGEFLEEGTQFDSDGNMLYVGGYKNGVRSGKGISYDSDGAVVYKGEWKHNLYHGEGILNLEGGRRLRGSFRKGKAFGKCTLTSADGRVIYMGGFSEDLYNGTGRLFSGDGGYAEGRFVDGEPTGVFNEYDSRGKLVYTGEWNGMTRNGSGVEYLDGKKVYEGGFRDSLYDGQGRLFKDGDLVYTGEFKAGRRCGFGVELCKRKSIYRGMWKDDLYDGCGILFEDGSAKYAGEFSEGKRNGRINEISAGRIIRKCIYADDELMYMCEYSPEGAIVYYGNVSGGERSGMGCSFDEMCEKEFEGIFKNGKPSKPMQVFFRDMEELPECEALADGEYEKYRRAPEYVIEKSVSDGIFTGQFQGGRPEGKGTIFYFDHRYTGMFHNGVPGGEGVIYMRDGSEIKGRFSTVPAQDAEELKFTNITYYRR